MSNFYVEQVARTTFDEFEQQLQDKRIVVIYPRHRSRSALVAMFLEHYGQRIVYYGLGLEDSSLTAWLRHMIDDPSMPEGFGNQTRAALGSRAEPEDFAAAFGADLFMLRSEPFMLMLDTFDNLHMGEDEERFFLALPDQMPSHCQIVINARLLGVQPWNALMHTEKAGVVGNHSALGDGIYGDDQALGQLEVLSLSGGHVYIDGRPVTSWDGSLPRHLFYYFVDHPMVTRDEIFEVFWPKMSVKEATNVFHVTKRKISERLGYELTSYSGGFYVPSPRLTVHYDAHLFENLVSEAVEDDKNAHYNWYRAIQLYRSDFLPYINTPWVQARRDELKHQYAQALIGLGRYHMALEELDVSLGYLLRALREKPDWEDVHQDVMMIYYQTGRRDEAIAQYRQLEATLQKMFSIRPTLDTRNLFEVVSATS